MSGGVVLAMGLSASIASSYFLSDRRLMKLITDKNPTNFQPDSSKYGVASIYSVMWILLYSLCAVSALFLTMHGIVSKMYDSEKMQTSSILVGSSLLVTSVYPSTIQTSYHGDYKENVWLFSLAFYQTGIAALLAAIGTGVGDTFARGAWVAILYGTPVGLLTGWLVVATAIGIVLEKRVLDAGGKGEAKPPSVPGWAPALTAFVAGVLAQATRNPSVVVPSVVAIVCLPRHIRHQIALGIALLAWLLTGLLVVV